MIPGNISYVVIVVGGAIVIHKLFQQNRMTVQRTGGSSSSHVPAASMTSMAGVVARQQVNEQGNLGAGCLSFMTWSIHWTYRVGHGLLDMVSEVVRQNGDICGDNQAGKKL